MSRSTVGQYLKVLGVAALLGGAIATATGLGESLFQEANARHFSDRAGCQTLADTLLEMEVSPMTAALGPSMLDGQLNKTLSDPDISDEKKANTRAAIGFLKAEMMLKASGQQGSREDIVQRCMAVEVEQ